MTATRKTCRCCGSAANGSYPPFARRWGTWVQLPSSFLLHGSPVSHPVSLLTPFQRKTLQQIVELQL